jgi:hypothetical protein
MKVNNVFGTGENPLHDPVSGQPISFAERAATGLRQAPAGVFGRDMKRDKIL